jgi:hypothetical protein
MSHSVVSAQWTCFIRKRIAEYDTLAKDRTVLALFSDREEIPHSAEDGPKEKVLHATRTGAPRGRWSLRNNR